MKVVNNRQMRELDRAAIVDYHIPGIILMENAALAVLDEIFISLNSMESSRVVIVCGTGNNGGDGFAIARHLINKGIDTKVFILGEPNQIQGDAEVNYRIIKALKPSIIHTIIENERTDIRILEEELKICSLIVDAILGTGLKGEVKGLMKDAILAINESKKEVISIDIPSGIDGDTGKYQGTAIEADKTITFQLPKIGNVLFPGAKHCGRLIVKEIGLPKTAVDDISCEAQLITEDFVKITIPTRQTNTHKGTYGTANIIAGSKGMTGAGILAAKSALRSGSGIVKLIVDEELNSIFEAQLIEAITVPLVKAKNISIENQILEVIEKGSVIAIGPGCGRSEEFKNIIKIVLRNVKVPIVIDADGLTVLSDEKELLRQLPRPCILTPHPGEMSRLTGLSIEEIIDNPIDITREFSREWQAILLLKGARTIIADEKGNVFINRTGNPGMATAGSGDVLTGIITGFIAQGINPLDAALAAAYLHGSAGDKAAEELGTYSMLASDIIDQLAYVIKGIEK